MDDREKVIEYELQIEDMLCTIQERLDEFEAEGLLTEFERGRQTAYLEMMDIIRTRHQMILEVLEAE